MTQNQDWVKQRHLAFSPFAVTEVNAPQAVIDGIYNGNRGAVSPGFPSDGKISFFRVTSEDIGLPNTNLLKQASFDWPYDVAGIFFQVVFPRSIVDGADLHDTATPPALVADPLGARRLASRYSRLFQLFVSNTMLYMWVAEDNLVRVPLAWVGTGPAVWTEGLSISSGENETFDVLAEPVSPSTSAFSCRIGLEGKKDLWDVAVKDAEGVLKGIRIPEQQGFKLYTQTDPRIVALLNDQIFASGLLYEDRAVGVRFQAGFYGDRTRKANYGAT